MRFQDITRQKTWMRSVQVKVESVGEPQETQYGFCQAVTATDTMGLTECLNYFFNDMQGALDIREVGAKYYDIKWDREKHFFKCIPAEPSPAPEELEKDQPNWDKINLGKCRHGILCAVLQSGLHPSDITNEIKTTINQLAQFSMTGDTHEFHGMDIATGQPEPAERL